MAATHPTALRGTLVSFTDDPFLVDPAGAFVHETDGLVVCRNGIIEAVGAYDSLRSTLLSLRGGAARPPAPAG